MIARWKELSCSTQRRIKGCVIVLIVLIGGTVFGLYPKQEEYSEQNQKVVTRVDSTETDHVVVCDGGGSVEPIDENRIHITGSVTEGEITVYLYDRAVDMERKQTTDHMTYFEDYENAALVFTRTYHAGDVIDEWITCKRQPGTIYCNDSVIVTCPTNMDVTAVFTYGQQGTSYGWQRFLSSPYGDWFRKLLHIQKDANEQF